MDRNRRLSARLCLLLLGLASQAEAREPQPCASRLLDAVARQVGHDGWIAPSYESSGPFLAVACKPWPDDPAQTVIAMAYLDPGDTAVEGERHPHLLLAKADSRSGRLLERYDSDFEEDASVAVGSDSLWLDTARYRLSPTVRAFGVVFHSVARGASCPDAGFDNLLTLVVPAGEGVAAGAQYLPGPVEDAERLGLLRRARVRTGSLAPDPGTRPRTLQRLCRPGHHLAGQRRRNGERQTLAHGEAHAAL